MKRLSVEFECKDVKSSDDDTIAVFEGYGSTFDNIDRVGDYLVKGAFDKVDAKIIPVLWNHNVNDVLGGYTSIKEDQKGLYVQGELNLGVQKAVEARALMKAGHLRHMSIGYQTLEDEWDPDQRARALKKVKLFELSLTALPANLMAEIGKVKSIGGHLDNAKDFESFLREAGLSANESKCVISKGYAHLLREKSGDPSEELKGLSVLFADFRTTLKGFSNA